MKLSEKDVIFKALDNYYFDLGEIEFNNGYHDKPAHLFLCRVQLSKTALMSDKVIVFVHDGYTGEHSSVIKGTFGSLVFYHNNLYEAVLQRIRQYEIIKEGKSNERAAQQNTGTD